MPPPLNPPTHQLHPHLTSSDSQPPHASPQTQSPQLYHPHLHSASQHDSFRHDQDQEQPPRSQEDVKVDLVKAEQQNYDPAFIHIHSLTSSTSQSTNNNNNNSNNNHCFASGADLKSANHNTSATRTISPSASHRSTPTPSPTSSPSSPPFYTNPVTVLDLNSIVSYSQLIARREEVVAALKYRSGGQFTCSRVFFSPSCFFSTSYHNITTYIATPALTLTRSPCHASTRSATSWP